MEARVDPPQARLHSGGASSAELGGSEGTGSVEAGEGRAGSGGGRKSTRKDGLWIGFGA